MKQDLQFKISELRKDKIIYAVEACAGNLICLFGFFFSNQYFSGPLKNIVNILLLIVAVAYTAYMGIGNAIRLRKIKELESKL